MGFIGAVLVAKEAHHQLINDDFIILYFFVGCIFRMHGPLGLIGRPTACGQEGCPAGIIYVFMLT
jgi:hypothetical protein